jgi:DNA modification methylase
MHQQIVWTKGRGTLGRSHFMWSHEPCFYGWPEGMMPPKGRRPPLNATTVWDIDQGGEQAEDHPTQKPLEIFERPIAAHTLPGEIVLEPFSGSGSQILAAHRLGRRCFAMEKDPRYVDLAVRRWEKATGLEATLDGTRQTFAEVEAERAPAQVPEEVPQ